MQAPPIFFTSEWAQVDINQTTANPLAQIVHRSRALEFAKSLGFHRWIHWKTSSLVKARLSSMCWSILWMGESQLQPWIPMEPQWCIPHAHGTSSPRKITAILQENIPAQQIKGLIQARIGTLVATRRFTKPPWLVWFNGIFYVFFCNGMYPLI